jgi:hypothetical protein
VGRLTDSSGSTSRVRICSSAVITVTFISPPLVWIELAEGERQSWRRRWGCFCGRVESRWSPRCQ